MIKKLLLVLLSVSSFGAFSTSVQAALITEIFSYSLNTTTVGTAGGTSGTSIMFPTLDPFDSSLGQLDAVDVSIIGNTVMVFQTGTHIVIGPFGSRIVTPFTLNANVSLGFSGLTDYFNISPDLTGTHIYNATGLGESASSTATYNLGFTIDAASEALGDNRLLDSAVYSGGGFLNSTPLVSGDRADFLDSLIASDLLSLSLDTSFLSTPSSLTPSLIITTAVGLMQVDYRYTPNPVPAPAAIWLFGTGLIGLIGFTKRRKAA